MTDGLQTILDWYLQNINYWSIIMCMTIESSILPFPAELIIPPAAWKAANGELNLIGIILTGSVGAVLGALLNYLLAYTLGRNFIYTFASTKFGKWCMISKEKIEQSEQYFLKYGNSSTFIGRLTPGVRSFISIPAGLVRMPLKSFIIYTFLGSCVWNTLLALAGYFLYSQQELLQHYFIELSIITLIIGIVFWGFLIIRGIRNKKNK
ncbi:MULTISPECIES: DedA family protein [Porphyromonadaceae]|uniref:Membrane protein n=1 Tax=Sanguibacteroides justesenii TaxID=1547597 RepID=A0A0C3MH78_9PORP|nr:MULTISPECIES: DedA family protein [Porphyromonadaceae]KIO43694.1 membrane protein [Sanguibacteroides justesenii]KIO45858.1 membrane protein [Sanguibacteroides justesenii]PXZ45060.1 DedA family protein [Sanguibacteroides justesenii]